MKMTPLDIRKQEFARSFRGYDTDEVQAFLQMLSEQWEEETDERRRLEEKVRDLKAKMEHYERVEEALQEALQTARENKRKAIENAEREAEVIVKEAKAKAEEIKRDALEERDRLHREASQIGDRRGEIVARLRAFLMSEMELLARFEGDDPVGFIKLLPSEQQNRLREAGLDVEALEDEEAEQDEPANVTPLHQRPITDPASDKASDQPAQDDAPASPVRQEQPASSEESPEELPDYLDRFSSMDTEDASGASKTEPTDSPGDSTPRNAEESDPGDSPSWKVHALFNAEEDATPSASSSQDQNHGGETEPLKIPSDQPQGDAVASSAEIEKIRRILNDMD